ncbi:two component transcriptional regulator, LuxR family [Cnuella takakiae]|uniref:Two component transcriptional regulator, LuxR family n=1 Tax=Cnuella takakiae TaxID=1302690 RepID=A0A1M5C4J7_9BACT|nr:response regulator transcription factor [Cnuella takakiae]OLY93616.1 DNA-binding response regulator [Cnuella takakiae]SHF49362.1 two component transcriptional regulator, LuxR family [Cnuella takakiae]
MNLTSGNAIRVIIADDHALFRTGVRTALSAHPEIKVIGEAQNGRHLLEQLPGMEPDVVLLDIQMPVMDGLATLPEIKKQYPGIKVIMLSMINDPSMVTRMMELGANGYLTKDSDPHIIFEAIATCYKDEFYFNDLTNKALLNGLRNKQVPEIAPADVALTDKEITILKLMCAEKTTREIADMVDLSPRTVEAIRDKIKIKAGVKSMAGLVMYAVRAGIVQQP